MHKCNCIIGIQWNLCIMNTDHKFSEYQGVLILEVSLYDKVPFGLCRCPYFQVSRLAVSLCFFLCVFHYQ